MPPRTGISLAVLAAVAAGASAQTPYPPIPASTVRPVARPAPANVLPQLVPADAPASPVFLIQKSPGSDAPAPANTLPGVAAPTLPEGLVFQKQPGSVSPNEPKVAPPVAKLERNTAEKAPTLPNTPTGITREAAFRFESNEQLNDRLTRELIEQERSRNAKGWQPQAAYFAPPPELKIAGADQPYQPKTVAYPPYQLAIEPGFVVHRKLHFEELNSERHLWDLGFIQPMVSTLYFYKDVVLWPASLASNIHERYDTSAGKCLPGSPYPYSLYPPAYDLLGLSAETSILVGAAFIFP